MISTTKLLQLFDGNKHLVEQYIVLVKKEIPKELLELEQFFNADNLKDASIVAHSIKGQCDYLDLSGCSSLAHKIEMMANKDSFIEDKYSLLNQLKKELLKAKVI